jgi:hypothetical protein
MHYSKRKVQGWVYWCLHIVPAPESWVENPLRREVQEFKTSLGNTAKPKKERKEGREENQTKILDEFDAKTITSKANREHISTL